MNISVHVESTYNSQSAIVENDMMLSKRINRVSRGRDPCVNVPHRNKGSNAADVCYQAARYTVDVDRKRRRIAKWTFRVVSGTKGSLHDRNNWSQRQLLHEAIGKEVQIFESWIVEFRRKLAITENQMEHFALKGILKSSFFPIKRCNNFYEGFHVLLL